MIPASYPPLSALEAARAVAVHGSLSTAAGQLGVTPGALSRRVAAVENWLGFRLFERHGRGMRPTAEGRRYLSRIEEAFGLIETAAEPWRPRRGPEVVRVSVVPSFAQFWLLENLSELENGKGRGPQLRIEVHADQRIADLPGGEVDVAIRYGRGRWPRVQSELLFQEVLVPVAQKELAGGLGREARARDLLSFPLLLDSDASGWRSWLRAAGAGEFRPRARDRRFESYELVLSAAGAGLGIALARLPLSKAAIDAHRLVPLSSLAVPSPLTYHVVTRHGESSPAVAAFVSRLFAASPFGSAGEQSGEPAR